MTTSSRPSSRKSVKQRQAAAPKASAVKTAPVAAATQAAPVSEPVVETQTPDPISAATFTRPAARASTTKGKPTMTDTLAAAQTYADEAKTRFQSVVTDLNDKAKTALEKSSKAFEEMGELTKGNLEAVVESSKIAAKGFESLGQNAAEFGRKSFEKTNATLKSFAAIKSPAEFFQLQSELLSSTLDSFVSETSKNSEALLKLVNEINQPISNRVSVVSEKLKSIAA